MLRLRIQVNLTEAKGLNGLRHAVDVRNWKLDGYVHTCTGEITGGFFDSSSGGLCWDVVLFCVFLYLLLSAMLPVFFKFRGSRLD